MATLAVQQRETSRYFLFNEQQLLSGYPAPMVDHAEAKERTEEMYQEARERAKS